MKKTLLSAASSIGIVTAALLFTGCGDSDSSSAASSSTAGTQTGQFVKGPWKGIGYTRSNGVSGTTGVNGTFTYNPGENVTFNFGLGTATWVSGSTTGNSTNPAAATITSCVNPQTSTAWTIADAAKVSAIFSAYNISENSTADLSTFVSSIKTKVASVYGTSFNISGNTSSLDSIVANIGNITGGTITNPTAATAGYSTAVTNLVSTLASVTAASLPAGYSLNMTNKVVVLTDGVNSGSYHTAASNTNTSFVDQYGNNWTILGKLTGGVSLVSGNNSYNAKVVAYNISSIGSLSGQNISVSVDGKNRTYSFGTGTYTLKVDGTSSVNGTYNITSDGLGLNLYPSNTTTGGANATVTFEDAPTTGAIAKIWNTVSTTFSAMINSLTEVVYSTVSKVL